MICPKCKQEGIYIYNDNEQNYIECITCGGGQKCSQEVANIVTINRDIENALTDGSDAYTNGHNKESNPHKLLSDSLLEHRAWNKGWKNARLQDENEALDLSIEQLTNKAGKLEKRISKLGNTLRSETIFHELISDWLSFMSLKRYWFGYNYKRDILSLLDHINIYRKTKQ